MTRIPLIIITIILHFYTLIYSEWAIAQVNNPEEKPEIILIKREKPVFDDLKQVDEIVKVLTVVDGKTFVGYNGKTYMLASLDIQFDDEFSKKSKESLEEIIKDQTLMLFQTQNPKTGRQNRMGHDVVHALIEKDYTWIQATLIANGMARVRTTLFNKEQSEKLLNTEEEARGQKLGIWSNEKYKILTPKNAHKHIGGFHVVEGIIKKTATTKNNIYLNFGDQWKTDFTIGIEPKVRRALSKKNTSALDWAGKKVRIRGWIRSYNGPYIDLSHVEQIEILDNTQNNEQEE